MARWFETFTVPGLWKRSPAHPLAVAPQRPVITLPDTDGEERGASGTPIQSGFIVGEDYNPRLDGASAIKVYDEMRRSNGQVSGTLLAPKLPLKSADWRVDPPKDGDATDKAIAEFCHECLFGQGTLLDTWGYILDHLLLKLDFGTSVLEKVWTIADDNTLRLQRLAPRLPFTIQRWTTDPLTGRLSAVVQYAIKNDRFGEWTIPAEYAVVSVHQREGDNWWGRSILRPAYQHWWYLKEFYRISAIKWDRYGVGIPQAEIDESRVGSDADERNKIKTTLKNIRSNAAAWILTTMRVKYSILVPTGGQAGASGMEKDIEHHNAMIPRSILAGFLGQGDSPYSQQSSVTKLSDFFTNSIQAVADGISDDLTASVIADLCRYNFNMKGRKLPRVTAANVTDVDMKELADVLSKLDGGKFITADDDLEDMLRTMLNLPPLPATLRGRDRTPPPPPAFGGPMPPAPAPEPPAPPKTQTEARRLALKTWTDPSTGATYGREPSLLEMAIFAVREVPQTLDTHASALTKALADVRRQQLDAILADIVAKDERETGPFTDIRPKEIALPFVKDLERVIKSSQNTVALYGATQVLAELRRQGLAELRLANGFESVSTRAGAYLVPVGLTYHETRELLHRRALITHHHEAVPLGAADENKSVAKSALVASAQVTAERLSDAWYGRILEVALQERRTGKQGTDLSSAVQARLFDEIEAGAKAPARAEVNEAFSVGRAAEAQSHHDDIDVVEYSALLDGNTCSICAASDGEQMAFGSARYYELLPPNVACLGNKGQPDACRCVFLYLYKGRTV